MPTRQWTSDDLATAVRESRTWKAVCDRLDVSVGGRTFHSLQEEAAALGLDVSHFYARGLRKQVLASLTDERLTELVASSRSWNDFSTRIGYQSYFRGKARQEVDRRIKELGLDTSHFQGRGWSGWDAPVAPSHPFNAPPNPKQYLRRSAIGHAIQWFSLRGYVVSVPVEAAPYDLVVDTGKAIWKIQVKSSSKQSRSVGLSKTAWDGEKGAATWARYLPGEIDFYFVVLADGSTYLLPQEAVGTSTTLALGPKYENFRLAN